MNTKDFRSLEVWKKAEVFTVRIYQITKSFPNDERFGMISQVRRSSVSICANIAEGYVKNSGDFIRFLTIARGSLEETKCLIILSKDLNYLPDEDFKILYGLADEIGKMLYSLIQSLKYPNRYIRTGNCYW